MERSKSIQINQFYHIKRELDNANTPLNRKIKLTKDLTDIVHNIIEITPPNSRPELFANTLFPKWFKSHKNKCYFSRNIHL